MSIQESKDVGLFEDVRASFQAKGLTFVSVAESEEDDQKTTLTYKDGSGRIIRKEVPIRLEELEDTVAALDTVDSEDLANFLLR